MTTMYQQVNTNCSFYTAENDLPPIQQKMIFHMALLR